MKPAAKTHTGCFKSLGTRVYNKTSWSLLGPGVEVGLVPNIMKCINIFIANVIKDSPYNLWQNNSSAVKERQQEKKIFTLKVFEMMPMALWNFRLCFEPSGLPPLITEMPNTGLNFEFPIRKKPFYNRLLLCWRVALIFTLT